MDAGGAQESPLSEPSNRLRRRHSNSFPVRAVESAAVGGNPRHPRSNKFQPDSAITVGTIGERGLPRIAANQNYTIALSRAFSRVLAFKMVPIVLANPVGTHENTKTRENAQKRGLLQFNVTPAIPRPSP
jgi:hypothetical protein